MYTYSSNIILLALSQTPVQVDVGGLPSSRGVVECVLWNSADGFPRDTTHGLQKVRVPVVEGRATCSFDVEPGAYAVTLMHDETTTA